MSNTNTYNGKETVASIDKTNNAQKSLKLHIDEKSCKNNILMLFLLLSIVVYYLVYRIK